MADLEAKKNLFEHQFNALVTKNYELNQSLALESVRKVEGILNTELQNIQVKMIQEDIKENKNKLSPLYASQSIADTFQEAFNQQSTPDVGRALNILGLGTLSYFPDPKDFKSKSEVNSYAELQEYAEWLGV